MANLRVDKITSTETFETTGSVQFDGNSDYLSIPTSDDFAFGTGDFTIEFLLCLNSTQSCHFYEGRDDTNSDRPLIRLSSSSIRYYADGGDRIIGPTLDVSRWYHIAVSRSNGVSKLFVDGVSKGTYNDSINLLKPTSTLFIGTNENANNRFVDGFMSNLRVVKGVALYTSNFKPSMRELEVVPGTVLLACQSKTDASLEKTGKTITVNGTAVACELTPGLLTPVPKAGGGSAITGSVEFSGTGEYLSIPDSTDFTFGTGDFTIEFWRYRSRIGSTESYVTKYNNTNATQSFWFGALSSGREDFAWYSGSSGYSIVSANNTAQVGEWGHLAAVRYNGDITLYLNGVAIGSDTSSDAAASFNDDSNPLIIGGDNYSSSTYDYQGFISNVRIVRGTALYTDDFIPPTRELKRVPGTVLLCCQDSNDPTQEVTGKTISLNGIYTYDTVVNSGITTAPTQSNFTPQVGDDRKVTFEGVTKINTDAYFYLPTGDTESREATGTYNAGTRGIAMGGSQSGDDITIDYITIASTGDAKDFGDLSISDSLNGDAVADHTRGVCLGGRSNSPTPNSRTNAIQFVTISSTGNSQEFGDLIGMKYGMAGFSDSTRGISAGGGVDADSTANIDYITISSTGNAQDFGDCANTITYSAGFSSSTRGIKAGGALIPGPGAETNHIEYVTIQTTGNGRDFGDLIRPAWRLGGCSNAVRGVILEGETPAGDGLNAISYVTIASMGNAQEFGDATTAGQHSNGTSSSTRGVFMGRQGASPYANLTFIDFVHIMTTANAQDFGDLTVGRQGVNACSNGHGGLG